MKHFVELILNKYDGNVITESADGHRQNRSVRNRFISSQWRAVLTVLVTGAGK